MVKENTYKALRQIVGDIRNFLFSEYYSFFVIAVATICYIFHFEVIGAIFLAYLIAAVLVVSDDIMPTALPFMVLVMHILRLYDSFASWITVAPFVAPVLVAVVFHFVFYRKKIVIDTMFWPMLAVSIAITFGGAFSLSFKQYFSGMAMYYVLGLGFGQLLLYVLFRSYINARRKYDLKEYFVKLMLYIGLFAVIMMVTQYLENMGGFIEVFREYGFGKELEQFQYSKFAKGLSNNLSAIMLWTMPFPMYYIRRNKRPLLMFVYMLVQYVFLMLILSRGGILMGTVELAISFIYLCVVCKGKVKKVMITITSLCAVFAVVIVIAAWNSLSSILHISKDEARVKLFAHAIECFSKSPIFGTGLAYDGGVGYNPKEGGMYWYHSTPFQIIGSLGLVGVIAYTYQFVMRIYTMCAKKYRSNFNDTMLIAFIGFELMACVNPGDFCPLPFMLFMTMMFAVMEIVNEQELKAKNLINPNEEIIVDVEKLKSEDKSKTPVPSVEQGGEKPDDTGLAVTK